MMRGGRHQELWGIKHVLMRTAVWRQTAVRFQCQGQDQMTQIGYNTGRPCVEEPMSRLPEHFRLQTTPIADPQAVVSVGSARFTLLTGRLIRLEYGRVTDQPSQLFWHRRQSVPAFQTQREHGKLIIETDYLQLVYAVGRPFTADTLVIILKESGSAWHVGDEDGGNLLGTTRTLDMVSGAIKLEPGLLSRQGWTVVDDSHTLLFAEDGWLEPREGEGVDWYFFGYGRDYHDCLADYAKIAGAVPLIPRWALGNWWSRYWEYTQDELQALMAEFRARETPLSVCIVDMDWHVTDVGDYQGEVKGAYPGWTGYTWNRALFPDPDGFIQWLHRQGLKTALNLHPADGVLPFEAAYPQMAARLGVDPATKEPVRFDIADPDFVNAYFEILHHPEEARGVDFWWMDWQQERTSGLPGLDPLWWLNHLHFYDMGREGKRPFIFSRWGGLGNHRYPIGFSGDTFVNWNSLAFQPYFTATAANVGYGWWSHDVGGHMFGVEERELYTRWVQFGVFSPIFRLHSAKNVFHERRPWGYDAEVFRVTRDAMQLRHALIPYLYAMAWLNHTEHRALALPMYHDYPDAEEAYQSPQQYAFGTELIAAPFVTPAHAETRLSRQEVWLPEGNWTHFFSGEHFHGGQKVVVYGRLSDIPVFAKAGAIVPLGPKVGWGGLANPPELHLHLFAGADGRFTLYEDDGETTAYQNGAFALTEISQKWQGNRLEITVQPPDGDPALVPVERTLHLLVHGIIEPDVIDVVVAGAVSEVTVEYDAGKEALALDGIKMAKTAVLHIALATGGDSLLSRRDRTEETVIDLLRAFRLETHTKQAIADYLPKARQNPDLLDEFRPNLTEMQLRALMDVIVRDM